MITKNEIVNWIELMSLCLDSKNAMAIDELVWEIRSKLEQHTDSSEYKVALALESFCTKLSKMLWFEVIKRSN